VPQAYLKRHGLSRRGELNTIANRTLISDETNNKIKDKAPASYVSDKTIFPNGLSIEILAPHFIDSDALASVNEIAESCSNEDAADLYERFLRAREQSIITEIRRVCEIAAPQTPALCWPSMTNRKSSRQTCTPLRPTGICSRQSLTRPLGFHPYYPAASA
jgi:hypothetical protein